MTTKLLLSVFFVLSCCINSQPIAAAEEADVVLDPSTTKIHEEEDEIGYIQSLIVDNLPIASVQSAYQEIEVYNSVHFGRVFVLDECLQLTERDAPHYNEMLAHVPMMEYLSRRSSGNDDIDTDQINVLVVGGGDGYVVSELLKYTQITSIDHVELDEEVINVSKKYLPWSNAWEDERVNLVIGDGAKYVKEQAEKGHAYNVVIQDASDPFWLDEDGEVTELPSSVLYDISHFESIYKLLKPSQGVLMFQAETYNIPSNLESILKWRNLLQDIGFETPRYGSISISTYPTGQIGFFAAHVRDGNGEDDTVCKSDDSCGDDRSGSPPLLMDTSPEMNWNQILAHFKELGGKTKYYHPRIHRR